ncbi:YpoC family protein [Exiguobacterium flavidum]|uniref:YpoC family protein n=1 Tax=Exiguobacterium flavidum TaxID=2184695 RepID=UPI000DF761D4|nr:hypothetical protein [Exiguobacterium flavidum]
MRYTDRPEKDRLSWYPLFMELEQELEVVRVAFAKRKPRLEEERFRQIIDSEVDILFWINGLESRSTEIDELLTKPVNASDRIGFLYENLHFYTSFAASEELLTELHKLYLRRKVIEKWT